MYLTVEWYEANEQFFIDQLCKEWSKLSCDRKVALMDAAPDAYFAVSRLVRYHEAAQRIVERRLQEQDQSKVKGLRRLRD